MTCRPRVMVPVAVDRSTATTVATAAVLARQSGTELELVDRRRGPLAEARLRHLCHAALAAGAPRATYAVLTSGEELGRVRHLVGEHTALPRHPRYHPIIRASLGDLLAHIAIPVLVLGPRIRAAGRVCERLVVGLDDAHAHQPACSGRRRRSAAGWACR